MCSQAAVRLSARFSSDEGMTLVELLVAMALMGIILAPLIGSFVSMSSAEARQSNVVLAQEQARLALERMRKDIHCAHSIGGPQTNPSGGDTLILNEANTTGVADCPGLLQVGSSAVQWCTIPVAGITNRYRLYRENDPNTSCDGTQSTFQVDYLTEPDVWSTPVCTGGQFPTVSVQLPVDVYPSSTNEGRYNLDDQIALRNATPCT
jgi:prepilin-type N-terminal cleavage/methylation domain-containing protein